MSRFFKKHFYRLLTSAKQAPLHLSKPTSSSLRSPSRNPRSHSFNEVLSRTAKNSAVNVGLSRTPVVSRGFLLQHGRFFRVDAHVYQLFQRKGFGGSHGGDRTKLYCLILMSIGGFIMVYTTHQEAVPYTLRKHFVIVSPQFESWLADKQFDAIKKQWESNILPPIHPQAVRVHKIAKDIIQSLMEGTKLVDDAQLLEEGYKEEWGDHVDIPEGYKEEVEWGDHVDIPVSEQGRDVVLDDQWANKSRNKGLKEATKPFVEHLRSTKWEVIVVDEDIKNAFALPGGKIVMFTGLLKQFPGDAEIATVAGHEVAHVVARHAAEKLTRHFFVLLVELFVLLFVYAPDLVRTASALFLELPFSRSQELEADHIGLLLMAGAGYDPRVAPQVYEKLGELGGSSDLIQYVNTHPSGSKRGAMLRKTGTMDQAVNIYMEKTQGKTVEGFL